MVSALDVLPAELWELVFLHSPPNDLISLARTSRTFNARCILRFFDLCGTPLLPLLARKSIALDTETLPALAAYSCCHPLPLQLEELVCETLDARDGGRLLACVEMLVECCRLRVLSLSFRWDVYGPGLLEPVRNALLRQLCSVVSRFASQGQDPDRPVFVVTPDAMLRCSAGEVASWELNRSRFTVSPPRSRFRRRSARDGAPGIHDLTSIDARILSSGTSNRDVCFIAIDKAYIHTMSLPPSRDEQPPDSDSSACVNAILQHTKLPSIQSLHLAGHPDRASLRQFLEGHPHLLRLEHNCVASCPNSGDPVQALISPPLMHPSLLQLRTWRLESKPSGSAGCSLVAGLIDSPNIDTLTFSFPAIASEAQMAPFFADLRTITTRRAQRDPEVLRRVALVLEICDKQEPPFWAFLRRTILLLPRRQEVVPWATSPSAQSLARTLSWVQTLDLCVSSTRTARKLLPWLSSLPALHSLEVRLRLLGGSQRHRAGRELADKEGRKALLAEARSVLPRVSDLSLQVLKQY